MQFFEYHIHSADDHAVRWKWAVGSVAMWDNRYVEIYRFPQMLTRNEAVPFTELSRDSTIRVGEAFVRLFLARNVSPRTICTTVSDAVNHDTTAYFDPASKSRREAVPGKKEV